MITKKHIKTYRKKYYRSKLSKSKLSTSKYTRNYKNKHNKSKGTQYLKHIQHKQSIAPPPIILLKDEQVELLLLFSTLINYFILLRKTNASRHIYKHKIIELLKDLRKNNKFIPSNTTDKQINSLYDSIYILFMGVIIELENVQKQYKLQLKSNRTNTTANINTYRHTHNGGFYFKSLEEKGDKPITGADLTKLLDDVQQFFYNAKYTTEGQFLQDTDTVLSMLRGDVNQFKSILQYRIFPKYYTTYPPFIKWDGIKEAIAEKKWEDIPDYLLAYQSYLRSRDEYLVEKGLKSPSVLQKDLYTGFYDKLSRSLDTNIQQFQQARNKYQGKFFPITMPP